MFATPYYREQPVGEWFVFVAMTAFWVSLVTLFMYLTHAMEKFHVIPWLMIEFGFCALWTFFYFSAALAAAVEVSRSVQISSDQFTLNILTSGTQQFSSGSRLILRVPEHVAVWLRRAYQVQRMARGSPGPGREESDSDCDLPPVTCVCLLPSSIL